MYVCVILFNVAQSSGLEMQILDGQFMVEAIGVDEVHYSEEIRRRRGVRTGWTAQEEGLAFDGMGGKILHFVNCSDCEDCSRIRISKGAVSK